ncbi:MAG: sulfotransferase [Wenzhouxiangellaceae bacterium]
MFRLFLSSQWRGLKLWVALLRPGPPRRAWWARIALLLLWPLWMLIQLWHWLGFALDEVCFRGWRKVPVRSPLFVLGPPRTGTTALHRLLALDPESTTFTLWEGLFGLSVTGRRVVRGLIRLDRVLGRPGGRLLSVFGRRLAGPLDQIHPLSLDAPEEDFLCFLPTMQCFLLVALFPTAPWLWRFARLDEADAAERRDAMRWYAACIQKHLYVSGPGRRFVSKNASFCGLGQSLLETFDDAVLIGLYRDPQQVVPSQLSALQPALRAAGFREFPESLRDGLIEFIAYGWQHLLDLKQAHPQRVAIVHNARLRTDPVGTVTSTLAELGRPVGEDFGQRLRQATGTPRSPRTGHRYQAADFGLSAQCIERRFAELRARYEHDVRAQTADV